MPAMAGTAANGAKPQSYGEYYPGGAAWAEAAVLREKRPLASPKSQKGLAVSNNRIRTSARGARCNYLRCCVRKRFAQLNRRAERIARAITQNPAATAGGSRAESALPPCHRTTRAFEKTSALQSTAAAILMEGLF